MLVMLRQAELEPDMYRIELFESQGRAVGALIIRTHSLPHKKLNKFSISVYVDVAHRREGIGTQLLNRLDPAMRAKCKAGTGVIGSDKFWIANNVPMVDKTELAGITKHINELYSLQTA